MATESFQAVGIAVLAVAMRTAVGIDAAETSASVRAGIARFGECAWLDAGGEPIVVARVPGCGSATEKGLSPRDGRLLGLARDPLRELARTVGAERITARIALPEALGGDDVLQAGLAAAVGGNAVVAIRQGRAGGLWAIADAARAVAAGETEFAIAGGVDSYLDLRRLAGLDHGRRLRSEANRDGFIPGEAAAFLLLGRRAHARDACLALLGGGASAFEPGHLGSPEPYRGDGLAEAIGALFDAAPGEQAREVWSSMNGEHHWAKEWGVASIRHRDRLAPAHVLHHPADCLGDTGAASGAVMAGLAAMRLARRPALGPALVYASADHGPRATILLHPAVPGGAS